jgi:hypothetical protein
MKIWWERLIPIGRVVVPSFAETRLPKSCKIWELRFPLRSAGRLIVPKDLTKAREWFEKASAQGIKDADRALTDLATK